MCRILRAAPFRIVLLLSLVLILNRVLLLRLCRILLLRLRRVLLGLALILLIGVGSGLPTCLLLGQLTDGLVVVVLP